MSILPLFFIFSSLVTQIFCWSPTDSYAPGNATCPDVESLVRPANGLSKEESQWVKKRHKVTNKNLIEFLDHADLDDFDARHHIACMGNSISIGVSLSGGGYRAMLAGAGQLSALDNRTRGAWEYGLGGILESTTYLVGSSGGNWAVGTLAYNNWTSVQEILDNGTIWDMGTSLFQPNTSEIAQALAAWEDILDEVQDKERAGFEVSITDPWSRALSRLFFPAVNDSGAALTISDLRDFPVFQNHQMPLPIHMADGRTPGSNVINSNSTVFEISPFELGSWDPSLAAFTDVKYLGTELSDGVPVSDVCVEGFDNAGFIMGTSSSLFNTVLNVLSSNAIFGQAMQLLQAGQSELTEDDLQVALYHPNPFYNTNYSNVESIVESETLFLVDGGEDLQNIPFDPLLQPDRNVDIIFAFDNSADSDELWPNGTAIIASYERQFTEQGNGTAFPYVPNQETFVGLNLTQKPTFFGCDGNNLTSLNEDYIAPLVVYIANTYMDYNANTSTFQFIYPEEDKRGMIVNGFETTSRMNMTLDDNWRTCVSCAIIKRSQERMGIEQTEQCKQCFDEYCWDGTVL